MKREGDEREQEREAYADRAEMRCGVKTVKRSECAVLPLVLKGEWYDMIASGEKREEYREGKPYWDVRMRNWTKPAYEDGKTPVVEFRRGDAAGEPTIAFAAKRGVYGYWTFLQGSVPPRHPEWGERNIPRYVIRLGERVEMEEW